MERIEIDKKLSLEFENSRLSGIILHFPDLSFSLKETKNFLLFYTVLQMFLQGHLEEEKAHVRLHDIYKIKSNGIDIMLCFRHYADFVFKKVSENDKQYLLINILDRTAIAKKGDQDRVNLQSFGDYVDKEFHLVVPEKPLRLTRFQAQYYFNVLQKISYKW